MDSKFLFWSKYMTGFKLWSKYLDLNFKKKSKLVLLKKWMGVENLIQLFGSKMDVDWIIKNPIHARPYTKLMLDRLDNY